MADDLIVPVTHFQSAREQIAMLVKVLAYAATDEGGAIFVRAFLHSVECRRLLNEAQLSCRERVE